MKNSNIQQWQNMNLVAKDIITMKITNKTTVADLKKKFFSIMRKHGICKGTKSFDGKGIIQNNFEWSMCHELFLDTVKRHFVNSEFFDKTPTDLEAY